MRFLKKPKKQARAIALTGAVLASLSGLLLSQVPAYAVFPSYLFVAVGSDTTADVMDQFALDIGLNTLASYDATFPQGTAHLPIFPGKEARIPAGQPNAGGPNPLGPVQSCNFTRPNGSLEGVAALRLSINPNSTATVPGNGTAPQPGCVDFARSLSGPSDTGQQTVDGQLIFIPFALDALTGATGSLAGTITVPATGAVVNTPPSNVAGANFTLPQLQALYSSGTPETASNGVTYNPAGGPMPLQAGQDPIDLYVPQPGSALHFSWPVPGTVNGPLPPWVSDVIQPDNGDTVSAFVGQPVQENDGTAVTVDPNGFMPFSVGQYIGQAGRGTPRSHKAVLTTVNGVAPIVGGTLNSSFPVTRDVYSVVAYDRVVDLHDGNFDSLLARMLVGTTSVLCRDTPTITSYGFDLLSPSMPISCCSTDDTLRAYLNI